jgi:hypothetical protein
LKERDTLTSAVQHISLKQADQPLTVHILLNARDYSTCKSDARHHPYRRAACFTSEYVRIKAAA